MGSHPQALAQSRLAPVRQRTAAADTRAGARRTGLRFPTAAASAWATSAGREAATSAAALAASGTRRTRRLDVDVYYPRRDRRERAPVRPSQINRRALCRTSSTASSSPAQKVFVGPNTGLQRPPAVVEVLPAYHDNHARALPRGRLAAGPDRAQHPRPADSRVRGRRGRPDVLVFERSTETSAPESPWRRPRPDAAAGRRDGLGRARPEPRRSRRENTLERMASTSTATSRLLAGVAASRRRARVGDGDARGDARSGGCGRT